MVLNSLPKKIALAALIASCGIVWLNLWHQFVYTRSAIQFPVVSNWLRDAITVLLPVVLAVWIGIDLLQWMTNRFGRRLSLSTQSMLAAAIVGGMTSLSIVLIEANRIFSTGIGSEFSFLSNICGRIYPQGYPLLSILRGLFPNTQAFRLHIMLQDGANLALVNMAITILLILILKSFARDRTSFGVKAL